MGAWAGKRTFFINRISHLVVLASNDHVASQTIIYSLAELSLHLNHEFLDLAYLIKEIQQISREERVSSTIFAVIQDITENKYTLYRSNRSSILEESK